MAKRPNEHGFDQRVVKEFSGVPPGTQAVQRFYSVIDALRASGGRASFTELQGATGLAKSTLHRLLMAMTALQLAHQDGQGGYQLGSAFIELGKVASQVNPFSSKLSESLDRLAQATQDTVFYTERQGTLAVCLQRREATGPIRNFVLHPGDKHPLGIGAGSLAILSALPLSEELDVRQVNRNSFPKDSAINVFETNGMLQRAVTDSRSKGFALNPGMLEPSSWAIGVAVRDANGTAIGALSIASVEYRINNERLPMLVKTLQAEANFLNSALRVHRKAI